MTTNPFHSLIHKVIVWFKLAQNSCKLINGRKYASQINFTDLKSLVFACNNKLRNLYMVENMFHKVEVFFACENSL